MNFDEYIEEVKKHSDDEVVARFVSQLSAWKSDQCNAAELADTVERFFGNSWISRDDVHDHLYRLWSNFKAEAILGIGGMTVNERLYFFGLFDRYEGGSEEEQKVVYAKLCASI